MPRTKRDGPGEVNASSMADIAFLLLIFFLVTTTIATDRGLLTKLPAWIDVPPEADVHKRNVLEILVNSNDQLLVENDYVQISELKDITVKFLSNNGVNPNYSDSPQDAIVSIKNDRKTSYKTYLAVQNELKAGYMHLRDKEADRLTGGSMTYYEIDECANPKENLNVDSRKKCQAWKKEIKEMYPIKISEAEPK